MNFCLAFWLGQSKVLGKVDVDELLFIWHAGSWTNNREKRSLWQPSFSFTLFFFVFVLFSVFSFRSLYFLLYFWGKIASKSRPFLFVCLDVHIKQSTKEMMANKPVRSSVFCHLRDFLRCKLKPRFLLLCCVCAICKSHYKTIGRAMMLLVQLV